MEVEECLEVAKGCLLHRAGICLLAALHLILILARILRVAVGPWPLDKVHELHKVNVPEVLLAQ